MVTRIKQKLVTFLRDTRGNASIEALIFVPLILTIIAATFALFDTYRYKAINTRAAFTISDALSRETAPITPNYLDGMLATLQYLTEGNGPYALRVSLVHFDEDANAYVVDWSETRGAFVDLDDEEVAGMVDRLPEMLNNERLIVVETSTNFQPVFAVPGLTSEGLFHNLAFTRPRFAPKIVWSDQEPV